MELSRNRRSSESLFSRSSSTGLGFPQQNSKSASDSPTSSAVSTPKTPGATKFDPSSYNAGQSLASVLNNPKLGKAGIYGNDSSWSWIFQTNTENAQEGPPPLAPGTLPEIAAADFEPYLSRHSEVYGRFMDVREHASWEKSTQGGGAGAGGSGTSGEEGEGNRVQGEGLLACLREIPPLYFDSDFALENGATFQAVCPFTTIPANMMLQEKLSHYLDLVEVHLVKEISSRSDSFFEALAQLEDLNSRIVEACDQIRQLQQTVGLLDTDLVDAARRIQLANVRRNNLLALEQKLRLLSYINHALSTLRLLVASADCAAALDVIDDMRRLLESDDLVGLHCFRHLGSQLNQAAEAVNGMLMADFVREAIHETLDLEPKQILAAFNARKKLGPSAALKEVMQEGTGAEEEVEGLKEQLLPTIIGLLRTSKLPAVLRAYRETLIADIKAAIKCAVGELLPALFTQPVEGEAPPEAEGGQSLAYKLRGLSADAFVQLLSAVFATIQTRLKRAAQVRHVIEQILGGLQDSYAAAAVAAAFASGAAQAAAGEAAADASSGKALISGELALPNGASAMVSAANISKRFRGDVLRENAEAVCAACDAAHGRWAKLLGVRALVHPQLQLHEFVAIYDITNSFIAATEKVGGRLGYSIRGTLQSQSKSFVDAQHSARLTKVAAHLDAENWVAVDAPEEYQAIVDAFTTDATFQLTTGALSAVDDLTPGGEPEAMVDDAAKPATANGFVPSGNGQATTDTAREGPEASGGGSTEADMGTSGSAPLDDKPQANGEAEGRAAGPSGDGGVVEGSDGPASERDSKGGDAARGQSRRGQGAGQEGERGAAGAETDERSDANGAQRHADRGAEGMEVAAEARQAATEGGEAPPNEGAPASDPSSELSALTPAKSTSRLAAGVAEACAPGQEGPGSAASGPGSGGTPTSPVPVPAGSVLVATPEAPARVGKARPAVKTLQVRGQGYHVVNSALLLLQVLAEYLAIATALPALATEVVHRVAEILKLFNSRTCQLVLGAGAMQVSGLKSITAKHLALSSQCIALFYVLIGDIRRLLSVHIPEARKALLLTEVDRVGQDYRVHRDEIHSKLVAIMRERLQVHLRSLPAMVENWNKPDDTDQQASQFARALTKEVGVLHRVLSPLLLEADLRSIFTRVVAIFHVQLADTYSKIETTTPPAKRRLYRDVQLILQCMRALPAAAAPGEENKHRELEQLIQNRFGSDAPP